MLPEVRHSKSLEELHNISRGGVSSLNQHVKFISYAVDRHDALFVVGSLDETLELRGLRYHPIDIETSISRAHRSIAER